MLLREIFQVVEERLETNASEVSAVHREVPYMPQRRHSPCSSCYSEPRGQMFFPYSLRLLSTPFEGRLPESKMRASSRTIAPRGSGVFRASICLSTLSDYVCIPNWSLALYYLQVMGKSLCNSFFSESQVREGGVLWRKRYFLLSKVKG